MSPKKRPRSVEISPDSRSRKTPRQCSQYDDHATETEQSVQSSVSLPTELSDMVVSYLSLADAKNVALVSHDWNESAAVTTARYLRFDMTDGQIPPISPTFRRYITTMTEGVSFKVATKDILAQKFTVLFLSRFLRPQTCTRVLYSSDSLLRTEFMDTVLNLLRAMPKLRTVSLPSVHKRNDKVDSHHNCRSKDDDVSATVGVLKKQGGNEHMVTFVFNKVGSHTTPMDRAVPKLLQQKHKRKQITKLTKLKLFNNMNISTYGLNRLIRKLGLSEPFRVPLTRLELKEVDLGLVSEESFGFIDVGALQTLAFTDCLYLEPLFDNIISRGRAVHLKKLVIACYKRPETWSLNVESFLDFGERMRFPHNGTLECLKIDTPIIDPSLLGTPYAMFNFDRIFLAWRPSKVSMRISRKLTMSDMASCSGRPFKSFCLNGVELDMDENMKDKVEIWMDQQGPGGVTEKELGDQWPEETWES
ncbi:hypothetical protein P280DRAFT_515406 [Massarina eburnea CBS 473.64]|uniref:F-box domain-containing protein n=1 Tax=Massarina eburnea CBS 473.64 TaxID=1395130 RepID=A0A6A6S7I6_9PLEO|nr:hypothetical protein P280DRAFT_515406 [Massarina eburnea CBS 473.64]